MAIYAVSEVVKESEYVLQAADAATLAQLEAAKRFLAPDAQDYLSCLIQMTGLVPVNQAPAVVASSVHQSTP